MQVLRSRRQHQLPNNGHSLGLPCEFRDAGEDMRACGSSQAHDMIGTCCTPARFLKKSSHLTAHFTDRSSTCLTHFHQFDPHHPQTTPNSLLVTGIRRTPCATPPAGMLFGHSHTAGASSSGTAPPRLPFPESIRLRKSIREIFYGFLLRCTSSEGRFLF